MHYVEKFRGKFETAPFWSHFEFTFNFRLDNFALYLGNTLIITLLYIPDFIYTIDVSNLRQAANQEEIWCLNAG